MEEREANWTRERLLAEARGVAERAYTPYSDFRVGAVALLETAGGPRLAFGVNVENASYGLSLCAERAALAAACALAETLGRHGWRPRITRVAISCRDAGDKATAGERMPCGACRQWLAELAPDAEIYVDGVEGVWRVADLLPEAFTLRRAKAAKRRPR